MTLSKIALIISLGAAATAAYAVAYVHSGKHERLHYIPVMQPDPDTPFFPVSDEPTIYSKRAPMLVYSELIKNNCEQLKKIEEKHNVQIVVDNDFEPNAPTFFMTISGKPADAVIAEARIDDLLLQIVNKKCTPSHKSSTNQQ